METVYTIEEFDWIKINSELKVTVHIEDSVVVDLYLQVYTTGNGCEEVYIEPYSELMYQDGTEAKGLCEAYPGLIDDILDRAQDRLDYETAAADYYSAVYESMSNRYK